MNSKSRQVMAALGGSQWSGRDVWPGLTFAVGAVVISSLGNQQSVMVILINFPGGSCQWGDRSHPGRFSAVVGDAPMVSDDQASAMVAGNPGGCAGGLRVGLPAFHADEPG